MILFAVAILVFFGIFFALGMLESLFTALLILLYAALVIASYLVLLLTLPVRFLARKLHAALLHPKNG